MRKTFLIILSIMAGVMTTSAIEHSNAPAKAISPGQALIINGKQLVVSTTDGVTFHYAVSSYDTPMMHRRGDKMVIEGDTFSIDKIKALRFQSMQHYLLDEDSIVYSGAYAVENGLLAFRKTLNINTWNSLCVPFSMTSKQVRQCFGNDAQLAQVKSLRETDETAVEFVTVDLSDNNATAIVAGSHYILKPTREPDFDASNRISTGWTATRAYGPIYIIPMVSMATKQKPTPQNLWNKNHEKHVFVTGTFNRLDDSDMRSSYIFNKRVAPGCYFLNDKGLIEQHADSTVMQAFGSWFQDLSIVPTTLHFYLDGINDDMLDTSGINRMVADKPKANDDVYNISGQRVGKVAQLSSLKKGLYIVNGRKQIVK